MDRRSDVWFAALLVGILLGVVCAMGGDGACIGLGIETGSALLAVAIEKIEKCLQQKR